MRVCKSARHSSKTWIDGARVCLPDAWLERAHRQTPDQVRRDRLKSKLVAGAMDALDWSEWSSRTPPHHIRREGSKPLRLARDHLFLSNC